MSTPLCIYLGTENIDVMALSGSSLHPKIATFARSRLPDESAWRAQTRVEGPEAAAGTAVSPQQSIEAVAQVIQTILPKLGVPSSQTMIALPAESVVIRYFQMPAIPVHERKLAIAFEAKKYLPFKLEELVTDYEVVVRRSDPTLMRVMFFGIKKSSVATYLATCRSAGIWPGCLEPAPLSLMRLVRHTGQLPAGQVAALLHMEHDSATISIARDDLLYLSRNVSIAPAVEGATESAEPTADLLEALVNETRVSVDYYRRRFLGEPTVQKVILFSQEKDEKRIADLSGALDLPVVAGNPYLKMTGAEAVPPGLAVSTGLALRTLEKRPKEINLLPLDQRRHTDGLIKPLIAELVAAAVVLGIWYGISAANLTAQRQKLESIQAGQSWPEQVPRTATAAELRQFQSKKEQEARLLKALSEPPIKPSELLARLAQLLPQESWLQYALLKESLQTNPLARRRVLRLTGSSYAGNRDVEIQRANDLIAALRADPLFAAAFSEFSLDSAQRSVYEEEEITEFGITCATHAEDLKKETGAGFRSSRRGRP